MTRRTILPGRIRRHQRVRAKIFGTTLRPRLSIFRSNKYLSAQIIDDEKGETLASVTTKDVKGKTPIERSKEAGKILAAEAQKKGVKKVSFDRGGFLFSGKIKMLADGAREGGLEF